MLVEDKIENLDKLLLFHKAEDPKAPFAIESSSKKVFSLIIITHIQWNWTRCGHLYQTNDSDFVAQTFDSCRLPNIF